jgi:mRNA-degrading endonuclease RelE of RelBE toxin-antitoxin system
MGFQEVVAPEAMEDLQRLSAFDRSAVRDAVERHLRIGPTRVSRSKIKPMLAVSRPQYRLRVEDLWIYYAVSGSNVEVLAIVSKNQAGEWLAQF